MSEAYCVGASLWLGVHAGGVAASRGRPERFAADRSAARRALACANSASGAGAGEVAVSLSHTEGVGAALVAPRGWRVGVDVVRFSRVGPRHARAILDEEEWEALGRFGASRCALAWALKEAAAKATRTPAEYFPSRLRIVAHPECGVEVCALAPREFRLRAGWRPAGEYLLAWVWAVALA